MLHTIAQFPLTIGSLVLQLLAYCHPLSCRGGTGDLYTTPFYLTHSLGNSPGEHRYSAPIDAEQVSSICDCKESGLRGGIIETMILIIL